MRWNCFSISAAIKYFFILSNQVSQPVWLNQFPGKEMDGSLPLGLDGGQLSEAIFQLSDCHITSKQQLQNAATQGSLVYVS